MLTSLLLYLGGGQEFPAPIEIAVELARRSRARVRGLTLSDTRRLAALSATCESAAYLSGEYVRLGRREAEQESIRARLAQVCLEVGLDFDVRRERGNPLEVLPAEARFHDLVVTALPPPAALGRDEAGLTPAELIDLVGAGVEPLLVVREPCRLPSRVLMVSDGAAAAARAARRFLGLNLLPDAELRLLGVGATATEAKAALRDVADYCRTRRQHVESGWACGTTGQVLLPYAEKWGADLVVLGVPRRSRFVRRLLGEPAERLLFATEAALFAAG